MYTTPLLPECSWDHRCSRIQYLTPGVRPLLRTGSDQGTTEADAIPGVPAQGNGRQAQEQPALFGGEDGHHSADETTVQAHQG